MDTHAINFSITQYTNETGLSHNSIKTLSQDSRGFIWIGTENGLVRFDGLRFEKIKATLGKTVVLSLKIDSQDRIWVNWYGYATSIYDPKEKQWHDLKIPISKSGKTFSFISKTKDFLFIDDQSNKLLFVDENSNTATLNKEINNFLKNDQNDILEIVKRNNHVWLSKIAHLIFIDFENNDFVEIPFKNSPESFQSMLSIDNKEYVCTSNSIYLLENSAKLKQVFSFKHDKPKVKKNCTV